MPCSSAGSRVLRGESRLFARAALARARALIGDQRRDRDEHRVLGPDVLVGGAAGCPPRGRVVRVGLPGAGLAPSTIGGLTADRRGCAASPTSSTSPSSVAGPGRHALLGQPAGDLGDRLALLDVTVEDLAHDLRLDLVDLPEAVGVLGLFDVPVAVRRAREHRPRPLGRGAASRGGSARRSARARYAARAVMPSRSVVGAGFPCSDAVEGAGLSA